MHKWCIDGGSQRLSLHLTSKLNYFASSRCRRQRFAAFVRRLFQTFKWPRSCDPFLGRLLLCRPAVNLMILCDFINSASCLASGPISGLCWRKYSAWEMVDLFACYWVRELASCQSCNGKFPWNQQNSLKEGIHIQYIYTFISVYIYTDMWRLIRYFGLNLNVRILLSLAISSPRHRKWSPSVNRYLTSFPAILGQ